MSMEQDRQPTREEVLLGRLANRIGVLTAQLELAQMENEALREQLAAATTPPTINGEHVVDDAHEGVAPI